MARRGAAVVGLTTEAFHDFSRELLEQRNAQMLPLVLIGHPIGGIPEPAARALVTEDVVDHIVAALMEGDAS